MTIQLSRLFRFSPVSKTITAAAEQDKSLVFFVTDEGELSNKWENDYLKNHEILRLLEKSSIIIRLEEESPEAAVLCAFCPEEKAPYISIVKNGEVLANIPHTISTQSQFTAAIRAAFPSATPPVNPNTPAALFAERKARLDAQQGARNAQEQKERLERLARDKARREAETPARKKYLAEQKKLREDEIAEKRRILMLVENDKIERREREKRKVHGPAPAPVREKEEKKPVASGETLMTFRLLNGTMLKNTFPSESKLADVRKWLDKNRGDPQVPYNFQQIAPLMLLSASDEDLSLAELGFSHGTTLVLTNKTQGGMPINVGEWNPEWAE
ncbi:uncharacterized protein LAJ45_08667 [Morchella importuna]|uniref:uncharacterized protein n=1 Tax=Morchella importuna TaxID=1174673 RepID=UPI001E8D752E|nr:uncharacterized protein LAJ45_08667 [Morchella importuna]KAH8147189.1 hypothetical protein LAJ45_08667 [Morchella importuna]